MLEVKNLVTPSPECFNVVIHGMRNAFKSWERSDSRTKLTYEVTREDCYNCSSYYGDNKCYKKSGELCGLIIGEKDKQLLLNLCKAGDPSHRKVLRQLPVIMDITAPLYWWKQADQYKVGTVTNAESTMHTLTKEPFKLEDFSLEYLERVNEPLGLGNYKNFFNSFILEDLNFLRDKYLETKDTDYWYALNQALPQSYNQTRTWSANYEVLITIIQQRRNHKLSEWHEFIDFLLKNVPYLKEIVEAIDETKKETT